MSTKRLVAPNLEEYKENLANFNKYGFTMMSLILGHDLGLFHKLNEAEVPLLSSELADRAGMKERYVREWLGAMTAASVVFVREENGVNKYYLPKECFDTVIVNATLVKGVCECVRRLDGIKMCFKKEGPIGDPHAFDGNFWDFFGEFRAECLLTKQPFSEINELFSKLEKVEKVHELLGCDALDIGCGTGAMTMAFGMQYPNSSFIGVDTVAESIKLAKKKLENYAIDIRNVSFRAESTNDLLVQNKVKFDIVMMAQVLHNLSDPLKLIEEVNDLLKPGGKLVLIEIRLHSNHALNVGDLCAASQYSFSQFFCLPFSMSENPHIGFGVGWGQENLLKELSNFFTLDARFDLQDFESLFVLTKYQNNLNNK